MCGYTLRWLMSFSLSRRSSSGARTFVRSRNQHQHFGILQAPSQRFDVLDVIVPDPDLVAFQLFETPERAYSVMVVIKYRDLHLNFRRFGG